VEGGYEKDTKRIRTLIFIARRREKKGRQLLSIKGEGPFVGEREKSRDLLATEKGAKWASKQKKKETSLRILMLRKKKRKREHPALLV